MPNIVLIYCDDLGYMDLGCYGSSFYETPNIDALAARGVRFTQGYATCPVCSPSRASVMTGKYPASVGVTDFINWGLPAGEPDYQHRGRLMDVPYLRALPKGEVTVAGALRSGGYATWHVGKWHLGDVGSLPTDHGFDVNVGGGKFGGPWKGYFSPYRLNALEDSTDGEFLTDRLTDEAIGLIEGHVKAGSGRPFFLSMCHYAVHTPIMAKEADVARFRVKAARLRLDRVDPLVEGEPFPVEFLKHARVTRRMVQSDPTYAALIWNLDQNVGRLLGALEGYGLDEGTLVVFSSDNGGLSTADSSPTCNLPLAEGKGWMYDGGVRVPLIARWPGRVPAGTVSDAVATCADFFPTFLEAAGLPPMPEQHQDGLSLLPEMADGAGLDREAVYWHYPHYANQGGTPGCAVRSGRHKLIEFFEDGRLELYDLIDDVSESFDLSADLPEVRDRLWALLDGWKRSVEARIPEPNPGWVPG
ncbi:MAG: sulfatase [Oscillospiraceae bacterium]|nr:sulfatase [Oscillospiraceae bacterium]